MNNSVGTYDIVINTGPHHLRFQVETKPNWPIGSLISLEIGRATVVQLAATAPSDRTEPSEFDKLSPIEKHIQLQLARQSNGHAQKDSGN